MKTASEVGWHREYETLPTAELADLRLTVETLARIDFMRALMWLVTHPAPPIGGGRYG